MLGKMEAQNKRNVIRCLIKEFLFVAAKI